MTMELIRDTIRFEQVVGEGQSQTLIDRDIIVPDIKPDIAAILSVEGKVNITSRDIEQNRIAIEGNVSFQILYSASGEPQPIYSMNQSHNFSHYIDVPGALPKMEPEVNCDIEHIDFNKLNGRKFNVHCVLNLNGKVVDRIPVEIIKEVSGTPDIQLLRDTVVSDDLIGENTAQAVVRGTIKISEGIPAADELLKYSAIIHGKDISVQEDKVIINGNVFIPILFSSKEESKDIYRVEEDMVFTHTIEMPGAMPDMTSFVDYSVEDVYAELRENEEGESREIDVEVVVGLKVKVAQQNQSQVIIDAYRLSSRLESEMKNISTDLYFGKDASQAVIKESIALPEGQAEMSKIYDVICKPMVTEYKIVEDKVIVEGVAGCTVIYLAKGDERIVNSFTDEVPFRSTIALPGCRVDMKPEVSVDIESMGFNMLTKNEVEVKIILNCSAKVYEKINKDFIVKMEEIEGGIPLVKASITIYMVQPKDTIWKIAKRYYTTVENIVKVNEIADPEQIAPGMKLLIPKKM